MDRRVLVLALALAVLVLVVASALLVLRGGGLEGVLPGQPGAVVRLRPGEKAVVGGAEVMVDFGVAKYFVCRDPESDWELILEAKAWWVLAVVIVYYNQPPDYPARVAWVEEYAANLTTARGETVRYCDQNTCADKIWIVDWPRGEAVECHYYKNPYQHFEGLTFPIKPGDEPAVARFHLYIGKTRYTVEVRLKD